MPFIAYGMIWLSTSIAVSVAVYITKSALPFHKWRFIKHCGAYDKYICLKCNKEKMQYIGDNIARKVDNSRIKKGLRSAEKELEEIKNGIEEIIKETSKFKLISVKSLHKELYRLLKL